MLQEDNKVAKPKLPEETEKRKIKPKKVVLLVLFAILALAILIAIGIAIIGLIQNPTNTFIVENGTLSSEENAVGYVLRDETVVQGQNYKNGMEKLKTEGEKVAKGEPIFRYYTSGEEELKKKIAELDSKLQEALSNQKDLLPNDTKSLEREIDAKLDELYQVNDIQKIREYKKDINSYITKRAKMVGELSPSGSYIRSLIDKRNEYATELNSGSEYISAPQSGIVSYRIDGLEEVLSAKTQDFSYLSIETLENLNLKTGQIIATSEEAGKIINNFRCYIAIPLSSENAKEATVGDNVMLRLASSKEVEATIEYIAEEEDSRLIVFSVEEQVEELINYRKISVDVVWWSYTGLKIPNSAIIYENDLAYVVRNRLGYLDKLLVKIKKQNEKYALVTSYEPQELKELGISYSSTKKISLYDEILIHPDTSKIFE
mgnify:FL=1